jgi:hypothetical protein
MKADKTTWAGRVLTLLTLPVFLGGIVMMVTKNPQAIEGMTKLGWPASAAPTILTLEIVCLALYLFPPTAALGAVLLTGYLGGAVATHLRAGESPAMAVIVGALVWAGIYLREPRLRELLPLRLTPETTFRVARSTSVKAPPEKAYALVADFHEWAAWSPWEKRDPAMKKTYGGAAKGKGAVYEWDGNGQVGKGRMEIVEAAAPGRIAIKLDFFSPLEGHNVAEFAFEAKDGVTNVAWTMTGPLTPMGKVMHLFIDMDKMIGKDFEAGLAQMKALAEK